MRIPTAGGRLVAALVLLAIVVGTYVRAADLDRKLFWGDEAVTAERVSGHPSADVDALFDGRVHSFRDLRQLTERDPNTNVATVVRVFAHDDPHHSPLYYILDRFALDAIGTGVPSTYRLPSVIFGLLAIVLAFVFGTEFYRSRLGGGILAALVAVSPLFVLYSRQAREYSLFTSIIFGSSFLLLKAFATRSFRYWIAYAIAVALGIYTDPIFTLVVAAHAAFALVMSRNDLRRAIPFGIAAAAGLATFAPWALNGLHAKGEIADQLAWGHTVYPLKFIAQKWAFNTAALVFDSEFANFRLTVVAAIVLFAVLACAVLFVRDADARSRAFALPLTLVPMVTFVAFDIASGSHFSTIARYLTAGWVGLTIVVASTLVSGIRAGSRLAYATFAFAIVIGSAGAILDHPAENWWENNNQVAYQAVGRKIATASAPLVIDSNDDVAALILGFYLPDDATVQMFRGTSVPPPLPDGTTTAFLLIPSAPMVSMYRTRYGKDYAIANVSPLVTTAITTFHENLRTKVVNADPLSNVERPDNALWSIVRR